MYPDYPMKDPQALQDTFLEMRRRYATDRDAMQAAMALVDPDTHLRGELARMNAADYEIKKLNKDAKFRQKYASTLDQIMQINPDLGMRDSSALAIAEALKGYGDQYSSLFAGVQKAAADAQKRIAMRAREEAMRATGSNGRAAQQLATVASPDDARGSSTLPALPTLPNSPQEMDARRAAYDALAAKVQQAPAIQSPPAPQIDPGQLIRERNAAIAEERRRRRSAYLNAPYWGYMNEAMPTAWGY